MNIREKLKENIKLFEKDNIRIISHHDADGISSAGILCNALIRKQKRFHLSLIRSLNNEVIKRLKKEKNEFIVFCDMGSGQIENIEKIESKILVLDHHIPIRESEKIIQVNTHFFNINGSFEACASTLAFLQAIELDEKNWNLAHLFLAGVIGDRQHVNGLNGLNKEIVDEAIKKGHVKFEKDFDLNGNNILQGLVNSGDPYFDGISGNQKNTLELLKKFRIDKNTEISDLEIEKKNKLTSYLLLQLLKQGATRDSARQFIIDKYISNGIDTIALSNWINSCGRMGKISLGLSVCLGDKKSLEEAKIIREKYREELVNGLKKIKSSTKTMTNIQYFHTDIPTFGGAYAGISMQFLLDQNKPTIALSKKGKEMKISSRGTRLLLSRGLDLAIGLRTAAKFCNGDGGGHKIASGATIPIEKEKKFLEKLDVIIGEQLRP